MGLITHNTSSGNHDEFTVAAVGDFEIFFRSNLVGESDSTTKRYINVPGGMGAKSGFIVPSAAIDIIQINGQTMKIPMCISTTGWYWPGFGNRAEISYLKVYIRTANTLLDVVVD
jgi:hypothetical protein